MAFTLNLDPLTAIRGLAYASVVSHFNRLAQNNAHGDMVAMLAVSRGEPLVHPIEARHALLQGIQSDIAAAQSTDDVDRALARLGTGLTVDKLLIS